MTRKTRQKLIQKLGSYRAYCELLYPERGCMLTIHEVDGKMLIEGVQISPDELVILRNQRTRKYGNDYLLSIDPKNIMTKEESERLEQVRLQKEAEYQQQKQAREEATTWKVKY
jgi:hypothetical protein